MFTAKDHTWGRETPFRGGLQNIFFFLLSWALRHSRKASFTQARALCTRPHTKSPSAAVENKSEQYSSIYPLNRRCIFSRKLKRMTLCLKILVKHAFMQRHATPSLSLAPLPTPPFPVVHGGCVPLIEKAGTWYRWY